MKLHTTIDARSLALGEAVADRLRSDSKLAERGKITVERWLKDCSPRVRPTLVEWQRVLNGPTSEILDLLTSTSERATQLRQSNPFAGLLSQKERTAIFRKFAVYDEAST